MTEGKSYVGDPAPGPKGKHDACPLLAPLAADTQAPSGASRSGSGL